MMTKPTENSPDDQRTSNRLQAEMRVYYGASHDLVLSGFSADISSGGLFLQSNTLLDVDEEMELHFTLPEQGKIFHCSARVAWVNTEEEPDKPDFPKGFGVQFINVSLDSIKAIQRFLKHNIIEPKW